MQTLRIIVKSHYLYGLSSRTFSTKNWLENGIGRIKKFIYGSANPYNSQDLIYQQMIADKQEKIMSVSTAKVIYCHDKAKKRVLRHNERIRKLEDKIQGDVFKISTLKNRF